MLTSTVALTACTDEFNENRPQTTSQLKVDVRVQPTSRAMVTGTALPDGKQIGVTVTNTKGEAYDGITMYTNVPFTAETGTDGQVWNPAIPIMLSGTEGMMHAYYPYKNEDYTAMPVKVAEQDDWMVAEQPYTVNDANPGVSITLKHVQTAINVNVQRDQAYTGEGKVTELAITSDGLASEAELDTRTGTFSAFDGTGEPISVITSPFQLTAESSTQENPHMFIPASTEKQNFTVTATIDGQQYEHEVTMSEPFAQGKVYKLNVKITSTGLKVDDAVILQDWDVFDEFDEVTMEPGKDVQGTDYSEWVQLTYKVEDASQPVELFDYFYDEWEDEDTGETVIEESGLDLELIDKMSIEGVGEITPTHQYTFPSTGEHTVYVKFKDMTTIPEYAFDDCVIKKKIGYDDEEDEPIYQVIGGLISVTIPNSVQTIGDGAFVDCTGLTEVTIPNSVTTIGNLAFSGCTGITEVTIGSGVQTIGDNAFYYCTALTEVTIGNSVQTIRDNAFCYCYGLTSVTIPNSVTNIGEDAFGFCKGLTEIAIPNSVKTIGYAAFEYCKGLTEVTIGNSVTSIGDCAFYECSNLAKITSLATTAPEIEEYTFCDIKTNGILYVPTGATGYDIWMQTDDCYLGYYNWTCQEITE